MVEGTTWLEEAQTSLRGAGPRSGRAVHTTLTLRATSGLHRAPSTATAVAPVAGTAVAVAKGGTVANQGTISSSNSRDLADTTSRDSRRTTAQATPSTTRTSTLSSSALPLTSRTIASPSLAPLFLLSPAIDSIRCLSQRISSHNQLWFSALPPPNF